MKTLTIDEALKFLKKAKTKVGGDACLILSLTSSGIEDADVNSMSVIENGDGSGYVEVEVIHPSLSKK